MKRLTIIRHAKSSWDDPSVRDFDRELNKRGLRDAPEMGQRLRARGFAPDGIVSSPAKRALATAAIIADAIGFDADGIVTDERIYEADVEDLAAVARDLEDDWNHVVLFGHNPGFTSFANWLADQGVGDMPTCAVVDLRCDIATWREIAMDCASLLDFDYPKRQG